MIFFLDKVKKIPALYIPNSFSYHLSDDALSMLLILVIEGDNRLSKDEESILLISICQMRRKFEKI